MDVGRRIREERDRLGMRQSSLAERVGVSRNTIWRIETGSRNPSFDLLEKIAHELEVEPADLLREPAPNDEGPVQIVRRILLSEAGHEHLTRPLVATITEAQTMGETDIKKRIREIIEESFVLRIAARDPNEHLPEHTQDKEALERAQAELRSVADGLEVRVRALAEVGGGTGLVEEAERILEEAQAEQGSVAR